MGDMTERLEAERTRRQRIMEFNYVKRAVTIAGMELRLLDAPAHLVAPLRAAVRWCDEQIENLRGAKSNGA